MYAFGLAGIVEELERIQKIQEVLDRVSAVEQSEGVHTSRKVEWLGLAVELEDHHYQKPREVVERLDQDGEERGLFEERPEVFGWELPLVRQ